MPQQINLCALTLQKPRQQFAANTMLVALAVFIALGGCLCAAWVWNLERAGQGFASATQTQTLEMQTLKAAIDRSKAMAQPPSPELVKEAQARRAEVDAKELMLRTLQQGLLVPGYGHSDRLALVARSIPPEVWVTGVKADSTRMEVDGFTLEPSALNDWVARLSASPLMRGLRLATVKVQSTLVQNTATTNAPPKPAAGSQAAPVSGGREAWSFNLVSAQAIPGSDAGAASGGKP